MANPQLTLVLPVADKPAWQPSTGPRNVYGLPLGVTPGCGPMPRERDGVRKGKP